jgi:hypothetical protein
VQRGSDILKAVALGAKCVAIGRLQAWGLGAAGKDGCLRVLEILENEIISAMGLMGITSIDQLSDKYVCRAEPVIPPHEMSMWPTCPADGFSSRNSNRQQVTRWGSRENQLSKTVAIVGAADQAAVPDKSPLQHHAEAAHNALADAGLSIKDVDGLFTAGYSTLALGEYIGVRPKYTDSTAVGGSSFVIHIAHAIAAINAGYCSVALVTHGEAGRSGRERSAAGLGESPGLPGPSSRRRTASLGRRSATRWPAATT